MPSAIVDGLSLVDFTGHLIQGAILVTLLLAVAANLLLGARYARMEDDLRRARPSAPSFSSPVLTRIFGEAREALVLKHHGSAQALVEESFQTELKPLLLAERFVRSATGLVIILGLLGTFYGLTLSIGKLVHLVGADTPGGLDVAQAVSTGLTQALSGMVVAFSNSLLGVGSAVVLTVLGVFSNVTDRRTAFMVEIEACVERAFPRPVGDPAGSAVGAPLEAVVSRFGDAVGRLEGAMARFDDALQAFAGSTREFREFNLHLKDNVQRMSLSFGDFSEELKTQIVALKSNGRS